MTGPAQPKPASVRGRRILVVEDEYMIAAEIAAVPSDAGVETLGPVPRIVEAMHLMAAEDRLDAALLDVNLDNEPVWPVDDTLLARGVPLVLATGYDASAIPPACAHLPRREKPATGEELARVLARVPAAAAGG